MKMKLPNKDVQCRLFKKAFFKAKNQPMYISASLSLVFLLQNQTPQV